MDRRVYQEVEKLVQFLSVVCLCIIVYFLKEAYLSSGLLIFLFVVLFIVMFVTSCLLLSFISKLLYKKVRLASLNKAAKFLLPYKDIWEGLILKNNHCILTMNRQKLTLQDITSENIRFAFISSDIDLYIEDKIMNPWDVISANFSENTNFDSIIQACDMLKIHYELQNSTSTKSVKISNSNFDSVIKTDINNADFKELNALPLINTALAKRIIKKREEIGGFKTVEDVCLYLKFNVEKSIKFREYICVNPIIISSADIKNDERSVDW